MPTRRAVCYSCDLNFLFPTIVSAVSLRRAGLRDAHIVVGVVDGDQAQLGQIATALAEHRIAFEAMPRVWDGKFDASVYDSSRLPHSGLARFFLADLLPSTVTELLYLDGDTLALKDITPLLHTDMPAGYLGAVEDLMSFLRGNPGALGNEVRAYFQGLSLSSETHYFNSGVVRANRATFREICADAFAFFCANAAVCQTLDQSALNVVTKGRYAHLSVRFNWWTQLTEIFAVPMFPRVLHFAGHNKPWVGRVWPIRRYRGVYQHMAPIAQRFGLPVRMMSEEDAKSASSRAIRRTIRHWTRTLPNTAMTAWTVLQYERSTLAIPAA